MGPTESVAQPFVQEPYYIIDANGTADGEISIQPSTSNTVVAKKMVKNECSGIWSMQAAQSITPDPRSSHFTVDFPERDITVIGYGINSKNTLLNDIWFINHSLRQWSVFPVDTSSVPPRSGTTACLIGDNIWLFGGYREGVYLQDLHIINIHSKQVVFPQTTGPQPAPRVGHIMVSYGKCIYIWGGYNGDWLTNFYILNTETLEWRELHTELRGRTSCSCAINNGNLYIFGSTRTDGLLCFNLQDETMHVVKTIGTEPSPELSASSMISIDNYLILIGGKKTNRPYQLIYMFDVDTNCWFLLPIVPDCLTVNMSDGAISKDGWFMTPTNASASAVYRKKDRELTVFMGTPYINPPSFFCVDIGNVLGYLHAQKDMLTILKRFH